MTSLSLSGINEKRVEESTWALATAARLRNRRL